MKTAISIPDDLFREIEKYAADHKSSRSEVFVLAVRDFLRRVESRRLLEDLNDAYSSAETAEEIDARAKRKRGYARRFAGDKY